MLDKLTSNDMNFLDSHCHPNERDASRTTTRKECFAAASFTSSMAGEFAELSVATLWHATVQGRQDAEIPHLDLELFLGSVRLA